MCPWTSGRGRDLNSRHSHGCRRGKFTTLQDGGRMGGRRVDGGAEGLSRKWLLCLASFGGLLQTVLRCSLTTSRASVEREDALNN